MLRTSRRQLDQHRPLSSPAGIFQSLNVVFRRINCGKRRKVANSIGRVKDGSAEQSRAGPAIGSSNNYPDCHSWGRQHAIAGGGSRRRRFENGTLRSSGLGSWRLRMRKRRKGGWGRWRGGHFAERDVHPRTGFPDYGWIRVTQR